MIQFWSLDVITESSKSYSVDQYDLYGDLRSDLMSMFEGDHVLRYFNRLFDGKGISLLLSGDKEVSYCTDCQNTLVINEQQGNIVFITCNNDPIISLST